MTLTVSKLAADAGIKTDTVRYYEKVGLLPAPSRSQSGYRIYDIVDRGRCPCGHTETLVSRKGDRYRRGDRATVRSEEGRPRGSDFKIRDPIQANGRASNSSWRYLTMMDP